VKENKLTDPNLIDTALQDSGSFVKENKLTDPNLTYSTLMKQAFRSPLPHFHHRFRLMGADMSWID
jgi:hypothetical protein